MERVQTLKLRFSNRRCSESSFFALVLLPCLAQSFVLPPHGRVSSGFGALSGRSPRLLANTGAPSLSAQLKLPSQIDWEEQGRGCGAEMNQKGIRERGDALRQRGAERRYRRMQR